MRRILWRYIQETGLQILKVDSPVAGTLMLTSLKSLFSLKILAATDVRYSWCGKLQDSSSTTVLTSL